MKLYILDITATKEENDTPFSFEYMCRAESEEDAIRKCEEDLYGCNIVYHSIRVER